MRPTQVSVNQVEEDGESVLELKVGPNDLGKVIGKQGRTARAMRNLLSAAGSEVEQAFLRWRFWNSRRVHHPGARPEDAGTPRRSGRRAAQRRPGPISAGMQLWALPRMETEPGAS